MALFKTLDGERIQLSPEEEAATLSAWAAASVVSTNPADYPLNGIKFRELLFDPARRTDVKTRLDTMTDAQRAKADAYLEGALVFRWNDPQVQWLATNLPEGAAAFEAAWVAKGQE